MFDPMPDAGNGNSERSVWFLTDRLLRSFYKDSKQHYKPNEAQPGLRHGGEAGRPRHRPVQCSKRSLSANENNEP